jgi:hypothetical protein
MTEFVYYPFIDSFGLLMLNQLKQHWNQKKLEKGKGINFHTLSGTETRDNLLPSIAAHNSL